MAYTKYSLTPSNNNAAPPDGAPEGMLPSAVNDTMRDMMAQIRDCGDGIRGGTYTMTAPVITGGSITGVALSGNTLTSPVITGGSINNTTVGATTRNTGAFTTLTSNGATTFTAGTASTSTTTGTAVITGGLGVSGRINAANFDGIVGANTAAAVSSTDLAYTGTLTGGTGIVNLGSGQFYKDGSGNVGIGTASPQSALQVSGAITGAPTGTGVHIGVESNYSVIQLNGGTSAGSLIDFSKAGTDYLGRIFYDNTSNFMFFGTNSAERMRIDSSGNVLVGTSSAIQGAKFEVETTTQTGFLVKNTGGASQSPLYVWNATTTGDGFFAAFFTEAPTQTFRGSITYNRAGGLVAYNVTSDYRAKDIISPVLNSGEVIDSVPVYMGKMKDATQARPMFIAHETPDYAHTGEKDAVDENGNPVYQQMDASSLVPVLWAEIQSLRKRVAQLESK